MKEIHSISVAVQDFCFLFISGISIPGSKHVRLVPIIYSILLSRESS